MLETESIFARKLAGHLTPFSVLPVISGQLRNAKHCAIDAGNNLNVHLISQVPRPTQRCDFQVSRGT